MNEMTKFELLVRIHGEEYANKEKNWFTKIAERMMETFPEYKITWEDIFRTKDGYCYRVDNTKSVMYSVPTVWMRKSYYAYILEDLQKNKTEHVIIETDYHILVIENFLSWKASVEYFNKQSGDKVGNKRRYLAKHETSKGEYIMLNGKRTYLDWKKEVQ